MGKIADLIIEMVKKQLGERGIVVWYDPQRVYMNLVRNLSIDDTNILIFEDGFFRLREKLEPFLEFVTEEGGIRYNAESPPSVIVYVPLAREESDFALIEAETAGVVIEPNAIQNDCNTRLGHFARKVFGEIAPAKAAHLARQADEGLLTLEELDKVAEDVGGKMIGALQVVFGNASAEEMILQFLASNEKDQAIEEKNVVSDLEALFAEELGFEKTNCRSASELRMMLRRHVLLVDLLMNINQEGWPEALRRIPIPESSIHRDLIRRICTLWRNRNDLKEFYIEASETVEKEFGIENLEISIPHLQKVETFPSIERRWLDQAALKLIGGNPAEALKIANERVKLFWAKERPEFQMEWLVIETAANVILESNRVNQEFKKRKWTFDEMVEAYALHAEPWMNLDRYARRLNSRYARLESVDSVNETLEKAINKARQCYIETLNSLAITYTNVASISNFTSRRYKHQSNVFNESIRPLLEQNIKIAYFLIDALRYEMACELLVGMSGDYESKIEPVIGQLPGITPVGMAALLPGAERGISLEKKGMGISVLVSDKPVPNRQTRMAWIQERAGTKTVFYKLGEVAKLTSKRKKEIEEARFIVVTSQEIDRIAEESVDDEDMRVYMEDVLEKVRRAIRNLSRVGVQQFIISADHGFHLIDSFDPGLSMDSPGGDTAELHPRVWIGRGGGMAEGYIRFKASDLELGGSLEFAFPLGLGIFKVKGGTGTYFHGGISPQEHILPLIFMKALKFKEVGKTGFRFKLSMPKEKITNRIFTVTIEVESDFLLPVTERRLRIEAISGRSVVGQAVVAAYGYEESSREIIVKPGNPNVVTMIIETAEKLNTITIQAIDCESQVVLDSIKDIPVELNI